MASNPTPFPATDPAVLRLRAEAAEAALLRLRAELVIRDTRIAQLREERVAPDLPGRRALEADNRALAAQLDGLRRALLDAEDEAARQRRRAEDVEALAALASGVRPERTGRTNRPGSPAPRPDRTVLCVGGGTSPGTLRRWVERSGARFVHHAGASRAGLDAPLHAADLVICQTGCLAHEAHEHVQQHCARTGKRCVFVQAPQRAEFQRLLTSRLDA